MNRHYQFKGGREMPKIKFGFKNAYYAKLIDTAGVISYDTPVKINGAVSMTLSPAGDDVEFYADDSLYYGESVNNGYDGNIEFAMIPEDFRKDILGDTLDSDNVLVENASNVSNPFALLCEFTTDDGAKKYAFYHCTAKRPELAGTTKGANKEVKTETLELKIRPRADGLVKTSTGSTTTSTVIANWYSSVHEPNTASV